MSISASVVIDNFNYARFLRDAIDSALSQDYRPLEVIVVDDGSTDGSRAILQEYDTVITVLKENGGQASGLNAGFAVSTGDFVCFLDADDRLEPGAIGHAAEALAARGVVKAHWRLSVIDEDGQETGEMFPPGEMPEGDLLHRVIEEGPLFDTNWLPPNSGNAWSRAFLEWALPIPEDRYPIYADEYLHALAPVFGKVASIEKVLGSYRSHGANNYWGARLTDRRIEDHLNRYESLFSLLSHRLAERGHDVDAGSWKDANWNYLWLCRLRVAKKTLTESVPRGAGVILVDDQQWAGVDLLPEARVLPFVERDGVYEGPPPDDDTAIAELERMRSEGAGFLALSWMCEWWVEAYKEFGKHLRTHYRVIGENDALTLFELTPHGAG